MKKFLPYLKNKFILASTLFLVYTLFLDDHDIFTIYGQNKKLKELRASKKDLSDQLNETRIILKKLDKLPEVERYAREEKFFKKDDEDIFVIFYE